MTIDEVIKELREASDSEVRYGDTYNHYDEVMKRVEAFDLAIKALEQTRWIPCSERLPEEESHVLVSSILGVTSAYYDKDSEFWKIYVIAWMPLPQPYKAESEDDK